MYALNFELKIVLMSKRVHKNKMSVLFIGDLHFQVSNAKESKLFSERVVKLAEAIQPSLICVGGDLLHTHEKLHSDPLTAVCNLLKVLKRIALTVVLVGNHDAINNQIFLTDRHWMNVLKEWSNLIIVDTVYVHMVGSHKFVFVPYVPPSRFVEALDTVSNWRDATCIFAHQEFKGCQMGGIVSEEGDVWAEDYPLVVSGHIHVRQNVQSNIVYSGSAFQHAFGEGTKNVVLHLNFDDDEHINEIDLELPRKQTLRVEASEMDSFVLPENADSNVRVKVHGTASEFKALKKTNVYKEVVKRGVKLVFDQKVERITQSEISTERVDFRGILRELVSNSGDIRLQRVHDDVVSEIM